MKAVATSLFAIAVFQIISTVIGLVTLLGMPAMYEPFLAGTVFAGQMVLAGLLLGVVVGGFQWAAAFIHLRRPRWLALGHALAGLVMIGWIFGECLVMNAFNWAHALWGGVGVLQVALVLVLLGVLQPRPSLTTTVATTTKSPPVTAVGAH